jgi:hypothetical protein
MSLFTRQIEAAVEINAPAGRVWKVLTDFEAYPEWNPFIRRARGRLQTGQRLRMRLDIPQGPKMKLKVKIVSVAPGRSFQWLGVVGVRGLFDGLHRFRIEEAGAGSVRLLQDERFSGMLVPLLGGYVAGGARRGFEAMNRALKQRVEKPI